VSGRAEITWQIIPSTDAGGDQSGGKQYHIAAAINYSYAGQAYSYTTQAESITVMPSPKLIVSYDLPYIVMAANPVKIKVHVTNTGAGPAHNLVITSAQPVIVENINNIPISFLITGASNTSSSGTFLPGVMTVQFGDLAPGATAEGYWLLETTRDGYFVEFTSTLQHQNYLGVQLDPIITTVSTNLVPAIGGRLHGPNYVSGDITVEVSQDGVLRGSDTLDRGCAYFIPDLAPGDYLWEVKNSNGNILTSKTITVVSGQPTSVINIYLPFSSVRLQGSSYHYPQTQAYKATLSMDITGPSSPVGWLKYYYARTRMNFASTRITGVTFSCNTTTIAGVGTVNNISGYTFTATVTDGSPDMFGITIRRSDGSVYYSASPSAVGGGELSISPVQ
jgi:hypothetical protein